MSKKHEITILWGECPEPGQAAETYRFDTEAELAAFLQGVEAMDGWMGWREVEPGYIHPANDEDD